GACRCCLFFFFFQAEDGIRDFHVTGVQTCALPISSVATRYQLGLTRQAGLLTAPANASTPHGTCESAMNAASPGSTSAANEAANFARSRNRNPSYGGIIGVTGAPGAGLACRDETDSPRSDATAAT